jgi:hypothetical protein
VVTVLLVVLALRRRQELPNNVRASTTAAPVISHSSRSGH